MKLGLILKITNGGEAETFSINKQEAWARFASDARSAIKELQGFDESDKTVFLLKFLGRDGYLLSVVKARPEGSGRPNDNTAAWIFVPSSVEITALEMELVLTQVSDAISENKGINKDKLNEIFNKEYSSKNVLIPAIGTIVSNAEGSFALRYYNSDYTLEEILGEHLAQTEYAKYKGVFLVDKKSGITHLSDHVLNFEPRPFIRISPLKSVDGFVAGFPTASGFVKFDREIEIPTGKKISIEWRKENYAPVVKNFTAGLDNTQKLEINDSDKKIRIQRSWFDVRDFRGVSVPKAQISINHQLMTGNFMDIPESLLALGISLDVNANGYEDFHEMLKELSARKIELQRRVYNSEYNVPIYDGEKYVCDAKLTFSAKQKISKSPLKGYEVEGRNNLVYCVGFMSKLKPFAYGFISCLMLILLYVGVQAMEEYEFQFGWPPFKHVEVHQNTTDDDEMNGDEIDVNANDSLMNKAVKYLDTHKSWNKDSLEGNEITRSLFDELNEFKVDDIKGRFEDKLRSSKNLQKVVQALLDNRDKGIDPHEGKSPNGGNYNKPTDNIINIDNYIKYLSVSHAPEELADDLIEISTTQKTSKKSKITGKTEASKETSKRSTTSKKATSVVSKESKTSKATTGTRDEIVH